MALALVPLATKAYAALKVLNGLRAQIGPQERERLKKELNEATAASSDVRRALGSALSRRRAKGLVRSWEQAREEFLEPPAAEAREREVFRVLTDKGEMSRDELARTLAMEPEDSELDAVLTRAVTWGHVRAEGDTYSRQTEQELLQSVGPGLRRAVDEFADRVVETLAVEGVASRRHLLSRANEARGLKRSEANRVLSTALERLVTSGEIEWAGRENYAMRSVLEDDALENPHQLPAEEIDASKFSAAVTRLIDATRALSKAVIDVRSGPARPALAPAHPGSAQLPVAEPRPDFSASPAPVSREALDAFAAAWQAFLGARTRATPDEIADFVLDQWEHMDATTRSWLPRMPELWAEIQADWERGGETEREQLRAKWTPVFEAFEHRLRSHPSQK